MSGVFGYLQQHMQDDPAIICRAMAARMCHLPHHRADTHTPERGVGLGRVGIGVLNREPQPVQSADGSIVIGLVGEFYHQEALRSSLERDGVLKPGAPDVELALQVYQQAGIEGVCALDGALTTSIWDARQATLWLVNDRYGIYPHYYTHVTGMLAFAPEIKALLCVPGVSRRINQVALAEYIRFQQLLGNTTWLADVQLLPPATVLRYRPAEDSLTLRRYWDWNRIALQPASIRPEEAVEEAVRLFQRGVDAQTRGAHRTGIFLSGGLDGRTILAFTQPQIPVTTLTFGDPRCRDVVYARATARQSGVPNHLIPMHDGDWIRQYADLHLALTEGMHSWMHMHGINALETARQVMDINLSGWDGGAILGGYIEWYDVDHQYRHPADEAAFVQRFYQAFCSRFVWPGLTEGEAFSLLSSPQSQPLRTLAFESLREELARTTHYPPHLRADIISLEHLDRRQFQNQIVIQRGAVDVRCPFYDYQFVEFIYSLPEAIRATPRLHWSVLTQRAPRLALIPRDKDELLPHAKPWVRQAHAVGMRVQKAIRRRIARFLPDHPTLYADYEGYLRTDLRTWAETILFDARTLERGLFDPAALQSLWQRHLSGTELWTIGKIAPLITLELVLRWLENEAPTPPGGNFVSDSNT